ncbi:GntR family transcriptional regulator [Neisseria arctica]|uniref:GntR family transcriptional regulator n=1 Tax=Neisseria arctica TaxID=1470200 RepID=A0A0J0YU19_9NEIS|nr:GntR family transcriptional regulator [Neisseria arctica]KLT73622.1 GntR family transcriptional regulator [Neisseria arctica]UOO85746.1 GntR family transcriptional regulator [Neisseria arctica]
MKNELENRLIEAPAASSMLPEERHDSELFRVYAAILDAITDRVLLPGKKLTESDLCRQMNCSRSTVRGALSLLAHDKIVDLLPNRGAFVHEPDAKETKDVYELRIALEEMVMEMLLDLPDLSSRLGPLYEMIEQEKIAFEQGDKVNWVRLVNAFHVELVRLLNNDVLTEMMNSLCARSSLMIAVFDKPVRRNGSYEEHKEILDLLSEGKRARVCKTMRRHLGGCQERLNQQFSNN